MGGDDPEAIPSKDERSKTGVERTLGIVSDADLPALVVEPSSGRIEEANRRFEELFHRPSEQIVGNTYRDLVRESRHREVRDLLSILSFGGSQPPLRLMMRVGDDELHPTTWVGTPTVLGRPMDPIVIVTRPTGGPVGKPLGPPSSLVEGSEDTLDRIPSRDQVREPRGDAEKSRSLWDNKWR